VTAAAGKSARNKGAAGERELAALLSDELGVVVKRKLGQARDGGDDIQVGRFRIEVKRRERLQVVEWCKQVEACSGPSEVPVLAFRRNGEPWRVVLRVEDFITMLRGEL
jgi:Holliday junction resolvase